MLSDEELDLILDQAAVRPSSGALVTSQRLAAEVAGGSRPRRSHRWLLGAAVGVLAVSGAGTLRAYQLHVPPFQSVPAGVQRASVPARITTDEPDGSVSVCEVFLEFSHVSQGQRQMIDAAVRSGSWNGVGDRLRRDGRLLLTGSRPPRYTSDLTVYVETAVSPSVPGVKPSGHAYPDGTPHFTGGSVSCRAEASPSGRHS